MLRISILLLASFVLGVLSVSSIVEFQEQFSELSRSIEPQLRDYRAENVNIRDEVIYRSLDALGNLTVEMRNITWDYWARIESHELANPECLERIREEFDYYVYYGGLDIQIMASQLSFYLTIDTFRRFYPVVWQAQRENSRAIYQTVQTLGRNQFLDNMADTVYELHDELEYYQNLWESNQERLKQEFVDVKYLMEEVEDIIEKWHEFAVRWHHVFMGDILDSVYYECQPENVPEKARSPQFDKMLAKMVESRNRRMTRTE